jgi:hypothetical protein
MRVPRKPRSRNWIRSTGIPWRVSQRFVGIGLAPLTKDDYLPLEGRPLLLLLTLRRRGSDPYGVFLLSLFTTR